MMNNTPKKENAAIELFSGIGNSDFLILFVVTEI